VSSEQTQPSLRPYRPALVFSFTNALTWMIVLGTPMVLLGEKLGASAFAIGLAYAAVYLALPVQVIATSAIPRFGYKVQMIFCWAARSLAIVVLLWIVWLARKGTQEWMAPAFVACAWYFCLMRAAGNSASAPWMYSFIPHHVRGRYFAMDKTVSSFSGIMILVTVSILFAVMTPLHAFLLSLLIALAGSASSTAALFFWPSFEKPPPTSLLSIARKVPALCMRPSAYRHYLGLVAFWWLLISPITPFSAYYLKTEAGLGQSLIIVYSVFQYVGTLLGALWVSKRLDRWGVRPFFAFTLACYALVGCYWVLLVAGVPMMLHFAVLAYFTMGLCNAFWFAPNLKYLPQVCPRDEQPLALALNIAVTGMAAGISPIVWGFFVKNPDGSSGMMRGVFLLYLGILVVSQLLLLIPFTRLKELENVPHLPGTLCLHIRLPRFVSHMLGYAGLSLEQKEGETADTGD
jgi:hypothetical protein